MNPKNVHIFRQVTVKRRFTVFKLSSLPEKKAFIKTKKIELVAIPYIKYDQVHGSFQLFFYVVLTENNYIILSKKRSIALNKFTKFGRQKIFLELDGSLMLQK